MPGPADDDDHVTILMGTRNGMPWLPAQLASFAAQTHRNWSLWVSDDGSTDATRAAVQAFAAAHPDHAVRLLEGPRQGLAANYLSLLCHPDLPRGLVALSDQDDVWMPHKLARAVAALRPERGRPAAWAARYRICDATLAHGRPSPDWPHPPSLGNAAVQNILSGHTLTLTPQAVALLRQGGVVQVPFHDWWIYLVLTATGSVVRCDAEIVLNYRQHGRNVLGDRASGRLARVAGALRGELGGWIDANLRALSATALPLTPQARALLDLWLGHDAPPARWRARRQAIGQFRLHRQSALETALIRLVALLGRL